jgi:hypothetical protein
MTTRKELLQNLINEFKIKVEEYVEIYDIIPRDLDLVDLCFFLTNMFNNKNKFDDTINDIFEIRQIQTKDNVKVKEIFKEFVEEFFKLS